MARYHALKQTAADQVTYFDATGDRSALDSATRDLQSALQVWERLVHLTDGLYPEEMAFGPDDIGHWKDKLPYVRHDLELVKERAAIFDRFGAFRSCVRFRREDSGAAKSGGLSREYRNSRQHGRARDSRRLTRQHRTRTRSATAGLPRARDMQTPFR